MIRQREGAAGFALVVEFGGHEYPAGTWPTRDKAVDMEERFAEQLEPFAPHAEHIRPESMAVMIEQEAAKCQRLAETALAIASLVARYYAIHEGHTNSEFCLPETGWSAVEAELETAGVSGLLPPDIIDDDAQRALPRELRVVDLPEEIEGRERAADSQRRRKADEQQRRDALGPATEIEMANLAAQIDDLGSLTDRFTSTPLAEVSRLEYEALEFMVDGLELKLRELRDRWARTEGEVH